MQGVKKLIRQLAEENGLTPIAVENIIRSQFREAVKQAALDTMRPIRLMYFGVFGAKAYRIKVMKEKKLTNKKTRTYGKRSEKGEKKTT